MVCDENSLKVCIPFSFTLSLTLARHLLYCLTHVTIQNVLALEWLDLLLICITGVCFHIDEVFPQMTMSLG